MTNTDRINEIRARLEAVVGGWGSFRCKHLKVTAQGAVGITRPIPDGPWTLAYVFDENDAELITHAPDDIAYLLAKIERGDALRDVVAKAFLDYPPYDPTLDPIIKAALDAYDTVPTEGEK
jgi:hypothetical protein